MLLSFIILKSLHPIGQPTYLEKMTLVQGRVCPQREYIFKALTGPLSHKSDYEIQDYKDSLESNKLPNEPPTGHPKAPTIDIVCYTKKYLQQIIQLVF